MQINNEFMKIVIESSFTLLCDPCCEQERTKQARIALNAYIDQMGWDDQTADDAFESHHKAWMNNEWVRA